MKKDTLNALKKYAEDYVRNMNRMEYEKAKSFFKDPYEQIGALNLDSYYSSEGARHKYDYLRDYMECLYDYSEDAINDVVKEANYAKDVEEVYEIFSKIHATNKNDKDEAEDLWNHRKEGLHKEPKKHKLWYWWCEATFDLCEGLKELAKKNKGSKSLIDYLSMTDEEVKKKILI